MSTTPSEAHYAQADAFLESCGFNPNEHFMRGRRTRLAQLLAESEARAVEKAKADCDALVRGWQQANDSFMQAATLMLKNLTAERERVRVLEGALTRLKNCDWVITPHDRMDAVRAIARAALAATAEHKEGSK